MPSPLSSRSPAPFAGLRDLLFSPPSLPDLFERDPPFWPAHPFRAC